jgi:RNA polymerase subunit RPABC4/transcription elongation factor Spt4
MAISNCRQCKEEVDSSAKNCPKCGVKNPSNQTLKLFTVFAICFGIAILLNIAIAFFKN